MKNIKHLLSSWVISVILSLAAIAPVHAALVPNFLLSSVNNNTQISMTVYGADASAPIYLYYPGSSSLVSANVGNTNSSGYFSTTITPSTYNVAIGASTYVVVNGAQSQAVPWPSYTNASTVTSGTLSLSQTNVALTVGQGISVSATSNVSNIGALTVSNNTNSSVVSASVTGSQIVLNGISAGSATVTVCASNVGCALIYVSVSQSSSNSQTTTTISNSISFSQSSITMGVGQSQAITLSGSGTYYVSSNSNTGIVTSNVSGSILTVSGVAAGNAILSVCSSGGNMTSCGNVNVTVTPTSTSNSSTPSSSSNPTIFFNPAEADMSIGQTVTVALTNSNQSPTTPVYYVSTNSNPSAVTVNINGNSANLVGVQAGGANITICQQGFTCANLYAYVSAGSGSSAAPTATSATGQPPVLTSFSVTSNNVNNSFMSRGVALTVVFNFSQGVINPQVRINGNQAAANGSGSGPYSTIYTMTGNEQSPLPISVSFVNATGASGQASFSIGTAVAPVSTPVVSAPSTSVSNGSAFSRYLYMGMTALDVSDPDVKALQERLKKDGFYTGPITGYFGSQTKAAVQAYQKAHKLSPLGVVGPGTRDLLNQGI